MDLKTAIVCLINKLHMKFIYQPREYQMLHGVPYRKEMLTEDLDKIRKKYAKNKNCLEAAYELKTYYSENQICSNTIVLKMRPLSSDSKKLYPIKIYNELNNKNYEFYYHAIEIFKENGNYKVFDILHRNKAVELEQYLDNICKINHCQRTQLRYDFGFLAPCHVYAENMQELSDIMRYLDKTYKIGKPRLNLINQHHSCEDFFLSDDIAMDFDAFGMCFRVSGIEVIHTFQQIYGNMMGIRFNILHTLCLGHISRDMIIKFASVNNIFDDKIMSELLDKIKNIEEFNC